MAVKTEPPSLQPGDRKPGVEPGCMLSGASVFIGLSAQLNVGGLLDFSKEIEEFFHCYKAGLLERIHEGRSKLSRFYEPVNYIALGPFDIATLALVDDFDLGCCAFHPLDQHWPRTEEPAGKSLRRLVRDRRTFFHQTIMGPMPCFSPEHDSKDLAIGCLFRNRLPLLGICQLELQHGLLIGAGADFLRCAIKAIRRKFDQVKKQSPRFFRSDIELLILESHAWHELTLLLFARSFEDIIRFVLEVREWTIDEMSASLRAGDAYDLSLFLGADTLTSLYCRLEPRTSVAASHVFGTSATTLAFRTGLCSRGGRKLLATVCKDDILYETRRWSARAGHVQSALAAAVGEPPPVVNHPLKFLLCAGRGDIVTPLPGAEQTSSWRLVKDMMPLLQDDVRQHEIGEHLITRSTSICHAGVNFGPGDAGLKDNNVHLPKVGETHPYLGRVLEALPHTKGVRACVRGITKDILEPLKRLGVPKVVAARLVNAFALLAQGLQDPHLVSNMLELLPFMQRIRRLIERPPNELDLADLTRLLADHADKFELAWHNRYRGGWHLGEVSDFTLEYKGGIEQLVSAFDAAYKALSESLVGEGRVLALVSPQPSITSTQTAIRLNYHDIFTPEFFAARVGHEAAETVLDYGPSQCRLLRRLKRRQPGLAGCLDIGNEHRDDEVAMYRQRFADICSYYTLYLQDSRLFAYWMRGCFIVENAHWDRTGRRLAAMGLERAFDRLAWVVVPDPARPWASKARSTRGMVHWSELTAVVARRKTRPGGFFGFGDVVELIEESYQRSDRTGKLLRSMHEWAAGLMNKDTFTEARQLAAEYETAMEGGRVPRMHGIAVLDAEERRERARGAMRRRQFIHTVALSHAFLKLLMRKATDTEGDDFDHAPRYKGLSLRDRKTGIIPRDAGKERADGRLLFDPRGGTFTSDADFRAEYFKYRCAYIASLADMAAKAKLHMPELWYAVDLAVRGQVP